MAESTKGKLIFTQSGIRSNLERLNRDATGSRVWSQAYGAADLIGQQSTANLLQDYSSAMNQAYMSASQNQSAIQASNVGTGYKEYAVQDLDNALNQAYESYLQSYIENQASLQENISQYRSSIAEQADTQADYVKRYEQAHYDYLTQLWKMHEEGTLESQGYYDPFDNEVNWQKYLMTDAEIGGNITQRLMSEQELRAKFFDDNNNLTDAGIDFYEQMEQAMAQSGKNAYTWMDYLAGTEEYADLADWSTGQYAFSYDPDVSGETTGQSMFNTLFGRTSDDVAYSYAERQFGLNSGTLSQIRSGFETHVNKAKELMDQRASKEEVSKALDRVLNYYGDLSKQFGLSDAEFVDAITAMKEAYDPRMSISENKQTLARVSSGAAGAATGAAVGSAGGPAGIAVGALVGYIFGASSIGSLVGADSAAGKRSENARDVFNSAVAAYLQNSLTNRR